MIRTKAKADNAIEHIGTIVQFEKDDEDDDKALPMGTEAYAEAFLSHALSEAAHLCEAGPIPQAPTTSFLKQLEQFTCGTFAKINDLPALKDWRRDLLFESVNDVGFGLVALHEYRSAKLLSGSVRLNNSVRKGSLVGLHIANS